MKISIRGDKLKITESMEAYISEKLEKLDKYIDSPESVTANVVVKVINHEQKVEITIPLKEFILRAEEVSDSFYSCIDLIVDKIERQIRKNKTKIESQNKKTREFVFDSINVNDDEDDDNYEKIVKRKKIEVKPMSEEEAIIQMELIGHQFYLFKDADTLKPTLIYKRKDGDYGIIETE